MKPMKIFLRLLKYFLIYKWRIIGGLIAVAIMSAADTASAFLIASLFDILQTISQQVRASIDINVVKEFNIFKHTLYTITIQGRQESFQLIYKFAIAIIVIILIKVTFVYVREYVMSSVQQKILMRFRVDLFNRVIGLPIRFYDENKTGFVMSRITNDVNNLEHSLYLIIEISQNTIYTLVFATALFYTNWQLTILTLFIFALSGLISRKFGDKIRTHSKDLTNTLADISSFLQEKIVAIRVVKSFTREDYEKKKFREKAGSNYHYAMKIVRVLALLSPTNELFNTMAASLLVIFCGYLFIQGTMTIETMIFFLILMINLAKPVKALGESAARIQKTLVSAGYIFEILDLSVEKSDATSKTFEIKKGDVEFKNVTFSYNDGIKALSNINIKICSGEKIALVGPSGGGKSTMLNLLTRFYELTEGEILIDDIDIKNYDLFALRSQIAVVPQDVMLFSGTVFSNIQYGKYESSKEEVISASIAANAHEFIEKLEKGYDTEVGERGMQLSGGQRQRIAIARAILRNPRLLLLDEATSALDTESENMVKEALDRLMEGRTSIIIAHRLSTIAHCDRIVVIDNGVISEIGTHDDLLSKESGIYRRLHSLQFSDSSA